jgi:hypothetical protein
MRYQVPQVSRLLLSSLAALFLTAWIVYAEPPDIEIEGSNILRFDEGDEVSARLGGSKYPDNTIARHFIENRLRLDVYRGNLRVGGRLLYFRPSTADIQQYNVEDVAKFDKRYVEAALDPIKLRLGHFSDLWGHGLALSLFENRDLYFDTELDGIRAELDAGPITLIGLRGSSTKGYFVREADVTGGRVALQALGQGLGFNYVFVDSGAYKESHVASFDWHLTYGIATFSGERAWSFLLDKPKKSGHATYLNLVLSKWNWSLLADYKDYNYRMSPSEIPFQNPPTVYREYGPRLLQGREPHLFHIPDDVGYQVELSGKVTQTTFTTLHYNAGSLHHPNQGGIPRPTLQQDDGAYWETFVSVEQTLPKERTLYVEIGSNEDASTVWQKRMWGQAKFSTPAFQKHELSLEVEALQVEDRIAEDRKHFDHLYSVGWDNRNNLSLEFSYQFTDDKELKEREGDGWPSAEAALTLGNGKHRMILFYGRERGGLKCSNGVCRPVQAFSGLRLTLESTL